MYAYTLYIISECTTISTSRDASYPKLDKLILEYENAVKKLVEDPSPISKVTLLSYTCNVSLYTWPTIYGKKTLSGCQGFSIIQMTSGYEFYNNDELFQTFFSVTAHSVEWLISYI